jgi:hypothetical protein
LLLRTLLLLSIGAPFALLRLTLTLTLRLIGPAVAFVTTLGPPFTIAAFAATARTATTTAPSSRLVPTRVASRLAPRARAGITVTVASTFPIAAATIPIP